MKSYKIVLVGYMASGKSSIGKQLAKSLQLPFIDLDSSIEIGEGMSVAEVFSSKGEIYFRKKEYETLNDILGKKAYVLSTGGGTPCYGKNMENILVESTHSFYLKLSISNIIKRIASEKEERPLVAHISNEELGEFVGKHLFERSYFYSQAKTTIDCDGKSIEEICEEIKSLI